MFYIELIYLILTGRKEDVANAKREILSAADHFSQIRACRKNNINGSMAPGPPTNVPGQTTINVTVPYRVVGLVVGPKGATIKRIQQTTQTYIVTPSRDKEPVFEVTGQPDSVEAAKREIESHIAMRTGNVFDEDPSLPNMPPLVGYDTMNGVSDVYNSSMYKQQQPAISASLNALLSSTGLHNQSSSLGSVNPNYTGNMFGSLHQNTSSMQSSLGSTLSNGLNSIGSTYNASLNQASISSALTQLLNTTNASNALDIGNLAGLGNTTSSTLLTNSHTFNQTAMNGGGQSAFGSTPNVFNDLGNFNILGENANNILNSKSSGLEQTSSATSLMSSLNCNSIPAGNSGLPYGLDEGLGSLGSSMGSSPALDHQSQASQNIWSDGKFPAPISSYNFSGSTFGGSSNTTSRHMSPTLGFGHGSVQRSNSDPTPQVDALASALSLIHPTQGVQRSNTSSPEDLANYEMPSLAMMSNFSHSSPVNCPLGDQAGSASSFLDFTSKASRVSPTSLLNTLPAASTPISLGSLASTIGTTTAASAVPIGTPAPSSQEAAATKTSPTSSRRSSVDAVPSDKICPSCKGESFEVAFVPCGHRRFCLPCAQKIQDSTGCCPSCHAESKEVIRIRDDHE